MSAPPQVIQFVWKDGIPFGELSKSLIDYSVATGMPFKRQTDPGGTRSGLFHIARCLCDPPVEFPHGPWEDVAGRKLTFSSEFTDAPWEDDPWPKPDTYKISWVVIEDPIRNAWWASFGVRVEHSLRYFDQAIPTKVHHMTMAFDGELCGQGESLADFEGLCRRYHQAKELYRMLDCDEVFAESPDHDIDEKVRQRFPFYRYLAFRVAKEGTQVLIKRMEERKPQPTRDWFQSRIFIDPPGVHGLSPEEYTKATAGGSR